MTTHDNMHCMHYVIHHHSIPFQLRPTKRFGISFWPQPLQLRRLRDGETGETVPTASEIGKQLLCQALSKPGIEFLSRTAKQERSMAQP